MNITAVWLRKIGENAEALIEVDGLWRLAIEEPVDGNFSHIVEQSGLEKTRVLIPLDATNVSPTDQR